MVNLTIVNNSTAVRASVITIRTNSIEIGLLKAMMIENLKEKMKNGIAHFIFQKKNGELSLLQFRCAQTLRFCRK